MADLDYQSSATSWAGQVPAGDWTSWAIALFVVAPVPGPVVGTVEVNLVQRFVHHDRDLELKNKMEATLQMEMGVERYSTVVHPEMNQPEQGDQEAQSNLVARRSILLQLYRFSKCAKSWQAAVTSSR